MAEQWQPRAGEAAERGRTDAPEVSWALRAVNRAAAEVDHALARRLRLRPMDYAALGAVMDSSPPMGPADLSTRLGISTGSATELVDRLERDGHVERHPHPDDRRRVVLQASDTSTGRLLGELAPLFAQLDRLADDLDHDQRETVIRFLRAAAERMDRFVDDSDGDATP